MRKIKVLSSHSEYKNMKNSDILESDLIAYTYNNIFYVMKNRLGKLGPMNQEEFNSILSSSNFYPK